MGGSVWLAHAVRRRRARCRVWEARPRQQDRRRHPPTLRRRGGGCEAESAIGRGRAPPSPRGQALHSRPRGAPRRPRRVPLRVHADAPRAPPPRARVLRPRQGEHVRGRRRRVQRSPRAASRRRRRRRRGCRWRGRRQSLRADALTASQVLSARSLSPRRAPGRGELPRALSGAIGRRGRPPPRGGSLRAERLSRARRARPRAHHHPRVSVPRRRTVRDASVGRSRREYGRPPRRPGQIPGRGWRRHARERRGGDPLSTAPRPRRPARLPRCDRSHRVERGDGHRRAFRGRNGRRPSRGIPGRPGLNRDTRGRRGLRAHALARRRVRPRRGPLRGAVRAPRRGRRLASRGTLPG